MNWLTDKVSFATKRMLNQRMPKYLMQEINGLQLNLYIATINY